MELASDLKKSILLSAVEGGFHTSESKKEELDSLLDEIKQELKDSNRNVSNLTIYTEELGLDLPDNWVGLKIKDIALRDVTYGIVKLENEDENGVKVLRCSDVKSEYIITDNIRTVTKELSEKYKRTILRGGEIVINIRGTLGGCAIVPPELKGYNIAREVAMIDVPKCLNKEYVMYCLISPFFWNYLTSNLRGIAYKGLNINLLNEFIIPIPSITVQNEIVNQIKKVNPIIDEFENYEKQLGQLKKDFSKDIRYSILQDAMQGKLTEQLATDSSVDAIIDYIRENHSKKVKEVENDTTFEFPENWKCLKLVDAVSLYTGNSISESVKASKYAGLKEGYDYIGTKDVEFDHTITYDNGVRIPFDEPKFKYAEKDATLLCIEGGSAGKKIAILDRKVCFGNKLCAFHPIGINKKYLYYYLQSPIFLSIFMDKISGIIGGVSINKIKQVIIPIPPIEEQQRIVEKLEQLIPICDDLKER